MRVASPLAIRAVLVLSAVIFASLGMTGSAKAAQSRTLCKNTYGGDLIYASKIRCSRARDLVRTWAGRYG